MPPSFVALHAEAICIVRPKTGVFAKGASLTTIAVAVALVAKLLCVYFLFIIAFETDGALFLF